MCIRDSTAGANAGSYAITGGTLALADGSGFKADNYTLKLADEVVYFTIHRAAYGDRTKNGSAMYDNNGTVDPVSYTHLDVYKRQARRQRHGGGPLSDHRRGGAHLAAGRGERR